MANRIKQMIQQGQTPVGCFLGFYSPDVAEIFGYAGFDFVVIDNEHGPMSWREVEDMIRACEVAGTVPIVRVSSSDPIEILKALDRGAQGIHVPQVNSKEQAEQVVAAAKFPPLGNRGTAFSPRAAKYGIDGGKAYIDRMNEDIFIAVHIETPQAVEGIEEIMSSGIDLAFIGPTDLSVSSGYPGDAGNPKVQAMIDSVLEAGKKMGVGVGVYVGSAQEVKARKAWGANYLTVGMMPVMYSAFKAVAAAKEE